MRVPKTSMAGFDLADADITPKIPLREYYGLVNANTQLRVWLPEAAKLALDEICEVHEVSMTTYLTEYFASYLFGYHELLRMRKEKSGLYQIVIRRGCAIGVMGAEEDEAEISLGKNIFALKIWVPEMIKTGLKKRADLASVTLGELLRSLICTHCFGREYGPNRLLALSDGLLNSEVANAWETD